MPLPISQFSFQDVPLLDWPPLMEYFGSPYTYYTAEGEQITDVRGILIEGVEDEPLSPGRYARFWVDRRDLPREPRSADWLVVGDVNYDVERVDATLYDLSRLLIKLSSR